MFLVILVDTRSQEAELVALIISRGIVSLCASRNSSHEARPPDIALSHLTEIRASSNRRSNIEAQ